MERETGLEPATNSLEGCDSTLELLPLNGWDFSPILRDRPFSVTVCGGYCDPRLSSITFRVWKMMYASSENDMFFR